MIDVRIESGMEIMTIKVEPDDAQQDGAFAVLAHNILLDCESITNL